MFWNALEPHACDGGFGAAGDDHVGAVVLNQLQGVGHGIGGAGAGRGDGVVRPANAVQRSTACCRPR